MNIRTNNTAISDKRLLTNAEAAQYLGLGVRSARRYLDTINAGIKFGSRVLFDKNVIDHALDKAEKT